MKLKKVNHVTKYEVNYNNELEYRVESMIINPDHVVKMEQTKYLRELEETHEVSFWSTYLSDGSNFLLEFKIGE